MAKDLRHYPAVLFEWVKGSRFPVVSNLFEPPVLEDAVGRMPALGTDEPPWPAPGKQRLLAPFGCAVLLHEFAQTHALKLHLVLRHRLSA